MDVKEILKHVDHTLLLQPSTWEEIKQICDDAMEYGTASVCIPPSYVKQAAEYMNGNVHGYRLPKWLHDNSSQGIRNKRCSCKWCFRNRYGNQYRLAERSEI